MDWFRPLDYLTGVLKKTENTVSIHRYASSWYSEKEKAWYKRTSAKMRKELRHDRWVNGPKRLMRKLIGTKNYDRIKKEITKRNG